MSEFFDYRCPYCRMMQPILEALVAKDHRVRLVAKEWPIFGGASVTTARIALASQWQGKYAAVHAALFKLPCTMDEASIRAAAASAGVDMARLDRDLASRGAEINAELTRVDGEARAIGFQGTPGFVVGSLVAPGAISAAGMDDLVNQARPTVMGMVFDHWRSLVGGMLIGLSAAILLVLNGNLAGISGIAGRLLQPWTHETVWRAAFLLGLMLGPVVFSIVVGHQPPVEIVASVPGLIVAGLLVGFGTRLGSGCTSGHGVCGLARLSPRSFAAVSTFMATAVLTVYLARHWLPWGGL